MWRKTQAISLLKWLSNRCWLKTHPVFKSGEVEINELIEEMDAHRVGLVDLLDGQLLRSFNDRSRFQLALDNADPLYCDANRRCALIATKAFRAKPQMICW